jgi:Flp pilus assembly protein TadD
MCFTYDPESKLQQRTGRAAVAALLGLAFFGLSGCDIPMGDRGEQVSEEATTEIAAQPANWATPAPEVPEPVEPIETVPAFDPATVTFEQAEKVYREGSYLEALDMFTAFTGRNPDNVWGHYMIGLAALKASIPDEAETAFHAALELNHNHLKSMINLSRVLLQTERYEEALAHLDVVVDIDPVSDDGYRLRGLAYLGLGRDEDAIDSFREAITVNEHDAWSMNNMGLVLIRQGSFEEALPPLARATELRDDVAVFHNNLGVALERTGHFVAAATAYGAALDLDGGYEKAAVSLARVSELEQRPEAAAVDLAALASQFVAEMQGWYPPVAKVPEAGEMPPQFELPDLQQDSSAGPTDTEATTDSVGGAVQDTTGVSGDSIRVKPDTSGSR